MKTLLLASALAVLSACDEGGPVVDRADRIIEAPHVGPLPPVCMSACAMELASPHACVDPESAFNFHGPESATRALTDEEYAFYVSFIASHYPTALARWYETVGHKTNTWMSGAQVIALGARQC